LNVAQGTDLSGTASSNMRLSISNQ